MVVVAAAEASVEVADLAVAEVVLAASAAVAAVAVAPVEDGRMKIVSGEL